MSRTYHHRRNKNTPHRGPPRIGRSTRYSWESRSPTTPRVALDAWDLRYGHTEPDYSRETIREAVVILRHHGAEEVQYGVPQKKAIAYMIDDRRTIEFWGAGGPQLRALRAALSRLLGPNLPADA